MEDGKFFSSSGVTAGIDLLLAVIAKLVSHQAAEQAANVAEYNWNRDADGIPSPNCTAWWVVKAEAIGLDDPSVTNPTPIRDPAHRRNRSRERS